jgi:hypothetical protein
LRIGGYDRRFRRMKLALLAVLLAACGGQSKPDAPPSGDDCKASDGGRPVFGVGDVPDDTYMTLQYHARGHCTFEAGPHAALDGQGRLRTTSPGFVWGTCGSARAQYLVTSVATFAIKGQSSHARTTATSAELAIGQGVTFEIQRSGVCGRALQSAIASWSLPTCTGIVEPRGGSDPAAPSTTFYVEGVGAGSCEIVATAGGSTATFALTVK